MDNLSNSSQIFILLGVAIIFSIVFKIIVSWIKRTTKKRVPLGTYQYVRKQFLLTESERDFFHVLKKCVKDKYFVFPQVRLSALADYRVKGQSFGAFGHIHQKTVDYVICDTTYLNPLLAIELDDPSHEIESRKKRDSEVETIFEQIGLPLLRFIGKERYNEKAVCERIQEVLKSEKIVIAVGDNH